MLQDAIRSSHFYGEESQTSRVVEGESNHNGAEQELLSEQERFAWIEITISLRKTGGYMPSSLGGRSFPVDRQADRQTKLSLKKF